jgi:hypothetical protein
MLGVAALRFWPGHDMVDVAIPTALVVLYAALTWHER